MIRFLGCWWCLLAAVVAVNGASPLLQSSSDDSWVAVHGRVTPDAAVRQRDNHSLRLQATDTDSDARAQSRAIALQIGKTYQVSGYVRTEALSVRDKGRSPIATGAALTMESMPFDVHSASVGGTRDWTRLSLTFVATRAQDRIVLTAGNGGALAGTAWFEHITLDEASPEATAAAPASVRTFGPAYRYPAAGWIYLHVEGEPYERGYQHGFLMAKEIPEYLTRCAVIIGGKADARSWELARTSADALFLRGFDRELLEEMRGIADGANAGGAKFLNRKLDLIDIVLENTTVELGELAAAMPMTPTGLEGGPLKPPPYAEGLAATDHCSAFAGTGVATPDGKMVIGHVTWWPQTLAEQTNVLLDIQPKQGHRVLMQSYPGGMESGTDWYQNDAGVVLTETTIRQTPFQAQGTPVAFRARRAAQYGGTVDQVIQELGTRNNGLYTNEWMIGDAQTDEIAMYELGTNHSKLWRSSRAEWFGDTPGFYWGDNNAKDLAVNLEYQPDPGGAPAYIPFVPSVRDQAWVDLYRKNKGSLDEQFAATAFDSAPLVSGSTMDAKIATAAMAKHLMVWASFGRPNESVAPPHDGNYGLYPGGYRLFAAEASDALKATVAVNERARVQASGQARTEKAGHKPVSWRERPEKLWKGWLLPQSDDDTWFVAGSAQYYEVLLQAADVEKAMEMERVRLRGLALTPQTPRNRYLRQSTEGVLFLDELRRKLGDEAFLRLMNKYFAANATKTVTAQSFLEMAHVPYQPPDAGEGPAYLVDDLKSRFLPAVIVYGTSAEAGTNRYAAEQLQLQARNRNRPEPAILKDFEANEADMRDKDVILVGRPETNALAAEWSGRMGLSYEGAVFQVDGVTHASERDGLVFAAKSPLNPQRMVVLYAGNSPLETARTLTAGGRKPAVLVEDEHFEEGDEL